MFGSQAQNLKEVILGEKAPLPLEFNKKRSRSIRIVKKDSRSIKTVRLGALWGSPFFNFILKTFYAFLAHRHKFYGIQKLSIGGAAEKIVSALHVVLNEHPNEDAEMSKCKSAVHRVRKMERDVDIACAIGKLSNNRINM